MANQNTYFSIIRTRNVEELQIIYNKELQLVFLFHLLKYIIYIIIY